MISCLKTRIKLFLKFAIIFYRPHPVDQNSILDALGSMGTTTSQDMLLKYILRQDPPNDLMIQRVLVHVATMEEPPTQAS